jgi:tetraacyldisaccharide 4'-kinase
MEYFRFLLYPFALVYGFLVSLRNKLFDWKIISSVPFPIPIISVGNLTAGGSGKTPMVEYLVNLFKDEHVVATLSRGYKRKTKGFLIVSAEDTVDKVGDEPLQFARKFPGVTVAVDESRRHGIRQLMALVTGLEVIILDDAFQHRYVKPWISILVTDYHCIYPKDHLLPVGLLREPKKGSKRANIIVVTKTPKIFSPLVRRQILEDLRPSAHHMVCFSYIGYDKWLPVYPNQDGQNIDQGKVISILMVTGIAFPAPLEEYLRPLCSDLNKLEFGDHQEFTEEKLELIRDTFISLPTRKKIIVTTEKDSIRFRNSLAESKLGEFPFYYVPIRFAFHQEDSDHFEASIKAILKQKTK